MIIAYSLLIVLVTVTITSPVVMGQDAVSVALTPSETDIEVGETARYDVVVRDVDGGGVGAIDVTVGVENTLASVSNASFVTSPGFSDVTYRRDRSAVRLRAALMDTNDSGTIVVATVAVEAGSRGTSALTLDVTDVGSEDGVSYTVSESGGATVRVESGETAGSSETTGDSSSAPTSGGTDGASGGDGEEHDGVDTVSGDSERNANSTTTQPLQTRIDALSAETTPNELSAGEQATLQATVENHGDTAADVEARIEIDGETVATQTVSLATNETRTVSFERRLQRTGTVRLYVAEQLVLSRDVNRPAASTDELTTVAPDMTDSTTSSPTEPTGATETTTTVEPTSTSASGFTVEIALVVIAVMTLALGRYRTG